MELIEGAGLVAGGGLASFAGAFAAIKVHISYLARDSMTQAEQIAALQKQQVITDRKADLAHSRIDNLTGAAS